MALPRRMSDGMVRSSGTMPAVTVWCLRFPCSFSRPIDRVTSYSIRKDPLPTPEIREGKENLTGLSPRFFTEEVRIHEGPLPESKKVDTFLAVLAEVWTYMEKELCGRLPS